MLFEESGMKELYEMLKKTKELKDYKEVFEVVIDIDKVDKMIFELYHYGYYDTDAEMEIRKKYKYEIEILERLEAICTGGIQYNYKSEFDIKLQGLRNLRHELYRAAVMKVLKLNGKDAENKKIVSKNYMDLIELVKEK